MEILTLTVAGHCDMGCVLWDLSVVVWIEGLSCWGIAWQWEEDPSPGGLTKPHGVYLL